ncbi:BCCT family transporter [Marinobacter changyiensis]|uniref:BCCT family transporter n=1 Tax=Marinobacter changyiensis TaxID=2604091 RepID=UPI001264EB76|nr:BCCT family transporter [Marinobacter changyiensis]
MLERLQRQLGLQTIPGVFFTSAGVATLFVALAVPFDEAVADSFGLLTGWVARNLGWFYILSVTSLLVFLLGLAVSRDGNIRLGTDDSRPDYSDLTWFTMLFAAGIGTILRFWGVAEPVSHFANPPFDGVQPGSERAASDAMTIALYHFGLHTWTISWAPYVGIFIARISRGRTIREFVAGVLFAPTAFTLVWFGIFGLSAIQVEVNGQVALAEQVQQDPSVAIFAFLDTLPLAGVASALSVVIIIIFFTTSSDSASLVIDMLTRRDDQPSLVRQRIFWAAAQGVIAATLLLVGGLDALQNVITALGLPFCILLIFMAVALFRALRADYRGYNMNELVQGRAFPEVEATSGTKQENQYVPETVDRD